MAMQLPDLDTRTVLDVVEENFQKIGLKSHGIRMIYIGEHTLTKEEIIEHFRKTMNAVNAGYCDINVSGLLLVYDSYFVHILEGSEDTIYRHLRFLFQREERWIEKMKRQDEEIVEEDVGLTVIMAEETEKHPDRKMFRRLKLTMIYHCIKKLAFHEWRALTARPPSLVGKLDVHGPLQDHLEQLRICLNKITKLCAFAEADENLSFEGLSAVDPIMEALPEVALVDFLLQSPHLLELREIARLHRRVDDYRFYFEEVWPLPTHFTPRHLYKLKVDDSFVQPLPVMPWENVKREKEGDEEGKEEGESGSSSSD
ncbi:testis-expressed protein 47-like [Anticarsia gemmatalis]|uniref:testis-expressed protein 47-like n=1 Tax=Anticarsia gemmatalis TaxID=129554 RepID=UPI003F7748E2